MKQTFNLILTSIVIGTALQATAEAQQRPAAAARGGAAVQQPLRDAAKAANQAAKEAAKAAPNKPKTPEQQRNDTVNSVVTRYVVGFQSGVGLTDEQARTFGNLLGQYVRRQLTLAQKRTDAIKQLKELNTQGASEEAIQAQIKAEESIEAQQINTKKRFYNELKPQLSAQQLGKLKVYLDETAQDLHQIIQKTNQ